MIERTPQESEQDILVPLQEFIRVNNLDPEATRKVVYAMRKHPLYKDLIDYGDDGLLVLHSSLNRIILDELTLQENQVRAPDHWLRASSPQILQLASTLIENGDVESAKEVKALLQFLEQTNSAYSGLALYKIAVPKGQRGAPTTFYDPRYIAEITSIFSAPSMQVTKQHILESFAAFQNGEVESHEDSSGNTQDFTHANQLQHDQQNKTSEPTKAALKLVRFKAPVDSKTLPTLPEKPQLTERERKRLVVEHQIFLRDYDEASLNEDTEAKKYLLYTVYASKRELTISPHAQDKHFKEEKSFVKKIREMDEVALIHELHAGLKSYIENNWEAIDEGAFVTMYRFEKAVMKGSKRRIEITFDPRKILAYIRSPLTLQVPLVVKEKRDKSGNIIATERKIRFVYDVFTTELCLVSCHPRS